MLVLGVKPASAQGQIARVYFAGTAKISADPNSRSFANEFGCAEARALEAQTLDKLARVPNLWFRAKMAPGAQDGYALLRPLLEDLVKSEWIFEMRDTGTPTPEYALAIRLENDRAQLWSRNLAAVLQSWTALGISQNGNGSWYLRKHLAPNLFQFSRAGGWVVIDCGQDALHLQNDILKRPEWKTGALPAGAAWLSAAIDWPRLVQLFPGLRGLDLPKTDFQVSAQDGNFLINGKLSLSQALPALEPWRVPTDDLHPPFTSFTAVRSLTPWLERQAWFQGYETTPMPQQFFFWTMPKIPFQTFAAAPVSNGHSVLTQIESKLPQGSGSLLMPVRAQLAGDQINIQGLPFTSPYISWQHNQSGDLLFGGFFPNSPRSMPLPTELLAQIATPNVLFYHWENTSERLQPLPQLAQLMLLITRHRQLEGAADRWLMKVGPTLGVTVTTAVQTGPAEVTFARRAPGGLTAMELFVFALWLEAPNFPGFDMHLPPPVQPHLPH